MAISAKIRQVSKTLAASAGGSGDGLPQALQIYPGGVDRESMAAMAPIHALPKHDPRRLRGMMERASDLARGHQVTSVFVGIAGREGDLMIPEFISFVESALRVEDSIFSLTRERSLVLLVDVNAEGAQVIFDRVRRDFEERFPSTARLDASLCFFEVGEGIHPTAKEILPQLFKRKQQ